MIRLTIALVLLTGCAAKRPEKAHLVIPPECATVELAAPCDYNDGHPTRCKIKLKDITCTAVVRD